MATSGLSPLTSASPSHCEEGDDMREYSLPDLLCISSVLHRHSQPTFCGAVVQSPTAGAADVEAPSTPPKVAGAPFDLFSLALGRKRKKHPRRSGLRASGHESSQESGHGSGHCCVREQTGAVADTADWARPGRFPVPSLLQLCAEAVLENPELVNAVTRGDTLFSILDLEKTKEGISSASPAAIDGLPAVQIAGGILDGFQLTEQLQTHPLMAGRAVLRPLRGAHLTAHGCSLGRSTGRSGCQDDSYHATSSDNYLGGQDLIPPNQPTPSQSEFCRLILTDCLSLKDSLLIDTCKMLPRLRELTLSRSRKVTDFALGRVLHQHGGSLEVLNLTTTGATSISVDRAASYCPRLKVVDISHQVVNDASLCRLARHCPMIRTLNLSNVYTLGDSALESIGRHLRLLCDVSISFCSKVTDRGVAALQQCPLLTNISLESVHLVTDAGLSPLLHHCSLLRNLNVRSCPLLTVQLIHGISAVCTSLASLDLVGCPLIDSNAALSILARSPKIVCSLRNFSSSERVVMNATPQTFALFGGARVP